ncbi:MAG: LytTR family DNA-binding domain-containing protein [Bacteroides sp.]|nr:LytTR family DNA-binding domain-containing protein [Roseburia sp.]MCM1346242.1 LytTR family DNA-binding domain-containing protein [Bacteroides sp.]MCM1419840.1 LytTR family DNA-binding domain-containing protein [Bacteroides sp.]
MRVLIVEDETAAYENMLRTLQAIDPAIEVAGNTESASQTIEWLQGHAQPDLIFMDIHLSDGPAFLIFDRVRIEVPIVFTTAYDQYAIEAFKVNSIDYLLKPIKQEEVERALAKFRRLMPADLGGYLSRLAALAPKPAYKDKILVAVKDKLIPVAVGDIACFYTTNKQTVACLKDGRQYTYPKTLEQIMSALNPSQFIRANKQYIIAKDSIKEITIWFDSRLLVSLSIEVPEPIYISKNKASEFKAWIVEE